MSLFVQFLHASTAELAYVMCIALLHADILLEHCMQLSF